MRNDLADRSHVRIGDAPAQEARSVLRWFRGLLRQPHFMTLAPLDVWVRLLTRRGARVGLVHVPWVTAGLFVSALSTVITLPERFGVWAYRKARRLEPERFDHPPGTIVVVGYFRSGTTHLHYLLSCDPRTVTPRWHQALVPQGFRLSWMVGRWAIIPFLPNRRPQDDMSFGSSWPAEDEFAICNWTLASAMISKFVMPSLHADLGRYHALEGLTDAERSRWRRAMTGFAWKVTRGARGRVLLLKSPGHTARVRELWRLFGGNVRFVHVSREPLDVIESNLRLHDRLRSQLLQKGLDRDELRRRIVEEYEHTERKFLAEIAELPAGRVARVRYQDIASDPMGELRRIYDELGLEWTNALAQRASAYLQSVRDYRAASDGRSSPADERERQVCDQLRHLFGHDQPPVPTAPLPAINESRSPRWKGYAAALVSAILAYAGWLGLIALIKSRADAVVWIVGLVIGGASVHAAHVGSVRLGWWCVVLTLLVLIGIQLPATLIVFDYAPGHPPWSREWTYHNVKGSLQGIASISTIIYTLIGCLGAFRMATRTHLRPPCG
jgi:hypothetical protein